MHSNTTTNFGSMNMINNLLTQEPEISSKLVGKAQGFYAVASQEEVGLLMSMNFAFSEGRYNGSTIAVLGRNLVMNKVREMTVVGGKTNRNYKVVLYPIVPDFYHAQKERRHLICLLRRLLKLHNIAGRNNDARLTISTKTTSKNFRVGETSGKIEGPIPKTRRQS